MGHDGGRQGATSEDADWDAAALQEWVAHVASTEDVSEREVLDRMLSALWILDEVESLWEDTEQKDLPDLDLDAAIRAPGSGNPDELEPVTGDRAADPSRNDSPSSGVDSGTLLEVVKALRGDAGDDRSTAAQQPTAHLEARLDSVVEDIAALRSRVDSIDTGDSSDAELATALDTVRDRLDSFEGAFDERGERIEAQAESLASIEDTTDSHAETLSAFGDTVYSQGERLSAVEDEVDATSDRLDAHDGRLDGIDDRLDGVDGRIDGVDERASSLSASQSELADAYEGNFDNIDVTLRFLVDRTDDVSATVEELESALETERRERRRRADERRRLAELRHDLASRGVTRATCQSCRNDVDVSCLLHPRCPHCDRPFDGHRRRGGVMGFFATDELTTTTRPGPRMQTHGGADRPQRSGFADPQNTD